MPDSEISIAHLLPDLLGTYSDAGNALVLAQRLRWRGVPARILAVTASDSVPTTCDLYLVGGGEDSAQYAAGEILRAAAGLRTVLTDRAVTLAVCAGLQLLGHHIDDEAGRRHGGLGVLDLATAPAARRSVGEAIARSTLCDVGTLTGFHNHRGATTLGPDATPLAITAAGPANDEHSGLEGARTAAVAGPGIVATYLHGPVLARNPALADHLLARVLGGPLPPLDPARVPELDGLRRHYLDARAGAGTLPHPRRT